MKKERRWDTLELDGGNRAGLALDGRLVFHRSLDLIYLGNGLQSVFL